MNKTSNKKILPNHKSDNIESRCNGLYNGIALRKSDNKQVLATHVSKNNGPFYCKECMSDVVVRKCSDKKDHFAHHARTSPVIGSKDQSLHSACKNEICKYLHDSYPDGRWQTERPIDANIDKKTKRIIPDISGRINGKPIAIEIQLSPYTIDKIRAKTLEYYKHKIAVLWVIPLKEPLDDQPFRPRLYEKFLHSLYFGRAYYWNKESPSCILPVHYLQTERYIEVNEWYDSDGQVETAGGYYKRYKTVKSPKCCKLIDIAKELKVQERDEFISKNTNKTVPKCLIFHDALDKWWNTEETKEIYNQESSYDDIYDDY